MYKIFIQKDATNKTKADFFSCIRESKDWATDDEVEVFVENKSIGVFTIYEIWTNFSILKLPAHLARLDSGLSFNEFTKKIQKHYQSINKDVFSIKFDYILLGPKVDKVIRNA